MKQTLLSFLIRQVVFFILFFILLFSYASFDFGKPPKTDIEIKIENGDVATGKLTLNPPGEPYVYTGKKVTWVTDPNTSNVASFWIEKKEDSKNIFYFFDQPPKKHTTKGSGRIDILRKDAEYTYAIHWKDKQENEYTDDPKITINPSVDLIERLIYILYGLFVLISSLRFILKSLRK